MIHFTPDLLRKDCFDLELQTTMSSGHMTIGEASAKMPLNSIIMLQL
jgi:hypothetical protein